MAYSMPPTCRGHDPFETASALQKAVRRSMPKQAVAWAMELFDSGHETWAWNRIEEITSEDIGPADRYLPATIHALREVSDSKRKRGKGGGMEMTHAVILLATAEKSGIASAMVMQASSDHADPIEIPDEALDQHTRRGKQMGRGHEHFATVGKKKIAPDDAARSRGHESMAHELRQLEADALDHRRRVKEKDPTLPQNPKQPLPAKAEKPAHNSTNSPGADTEQMTITDEQT